MAAMPVTPLARLFLLNARVEGGVHVDQARLQARMVPSPYAGFRDQRELGDLCLGVVAAPTIWFVEHDVDFNSPAPRTRLLKQNRFRLLRRYAGRPGDE